MNGRGADFGHPTASMSAFQGAARGAVLMGTAGALYSLHAAAADPAWWLSAAVLLGAVSVVRRPDSSLATWTLLLFGVHWATSVEDWRTGWLPVAALCLLLFHTAVVLASIMPSTAAPGAAAGRRWGLHACLVAAVTVAAGAFVVSAGPGTLVGGDVLAAGALAVLAVVAWMMRVEGSRA